VFVSPSALANRPTSQPQPPSGRDFHTVKLVF
jgi:hypothetical protein